MPNKKEAELGKTARSSTRTAAQRAELLNRVLPHVCAAGCGEPITVGEYVPVRVLGQRGTYHYHKACYRVEVPPGKFGQQNHPEVKGKQTAGKPRFWGHGGKGWASRSAAKLGGYTQGGEG